jgi:hypothetical protein
MMRKLAVYVYRKYPWQNIWCDLQAQECTAIPRFVELVRLIGIKNNHLPRENGIALFATGDRKRIFQHPNQFPFRMKMGRTIVYRIEKDTQTIDPAMLYDFQFVHLPTSPVLILEQIERQPCGF